MPGWARVPTGCLVCVLACASAPPPMQLALPVEGGADPGCGQ